MGTFFRDFIYSAVENPASFIEEILPYLLFIWCGLILGELLSIVFRKD